MVTLSASVRSLVVSLSTSATPRQGNNVFSCNAKLWVRHSIPNDKARSRHGEEDPGARAGDARHASVGGSGRPDCEVDLVAVVTKAGSYRTLVVQDFGWRRSC
ncbi:CRT (chloroquine-resistance transporter)-liketransporter 1 [Striga asiatica]|uniref:CRT (Chloroquine-resistance transporter)-liketransporter 1 n=1 Tax=Striga asiatica TaxID=4170 RepID=A0A5A7RHX3_STRAF|nr:CRT (chloroquine-resistance transporter)-liketransporter 1 [Striga asiatica]